MKISKKIEKQTVNTNKMQTCGQYAKIRQKLRIQIFVGTFHAPCNIDVVGIPIPVPDTD